MSEGSGNSTNDTIKAGSAEFMRGRHGLMGFILLLVRDPHQSEDIFQDVWVALIDALGQGNLIEDQAKWCRGVARNKAHEFWRRQRDARVVPDSRLLQQIELAFDENELESQYWASRREALGDCVSQLADHSRETLSLRYELGLSMAELAKRLGRTVGAVSKAVSRIRAALEECVERRLRLELDS